MRGTSSQQQTWAPKLSGRLHAGERALIAVAAQTSARPYVGCSLPSSAVQNCRNVLNFKSCDECHSDRMERGWTGAESGADGKALDLKSAGSEKRWI